MTPEERERMNSVCIGLQEETDFNRYATLLRDLSELLARKEQRRFKQHSALVWRRNRPWKTLPAVVNKTVRSPLPDQPDAVEISITGAEDLFREIRIENSFTNIDGRPIALTSGVRLEVTFEAETGGNKRTEL